MQKKVLFESSSARMERLFELATRENLVRKSVSGV